MEKALNSPWESVLCPESEAAEPDWSDRFAKIGNLRVSPSLPGPRLLTRLTAVPDHNRQDYLMRVAAANGLKGIPELCQVVGANYATLVSLESSLLNRFFSGLPMPKLVEAGTTRCHNRGLTKRGLASFARICPQCVAISEPLSPDVNLALPIPCQHHGAWPIDRCPSCSRPMTYLRRELGYCDCGLNLAEIRPAPPPPWFGFFLEIFAPWHLPGTPPTEFRATAALDAMAGCLIRALVANRNDVTDARRIGSPWISSMDMPLIEDIITQWPARLETVIDAHLQCANEDHARRWLNRFRTPALPLLALVVGRVAQKRIDARKQTQWRNLTGANQQLVSLARVRAAAKLDAAATRVMMASGRFGDVLVSDRGGRKAYWVGKDALEMILEIFKETIDVAEASRRLGCPSTVVRALAACGWLKIDGLPCKPRSPRFKPAVIEEFVRLLASRAIPLGQTTHRTRHLVEIPALRNNGERDGSWMRLMKGVMGDTVPLYARDSVTDMADLYVAEQDLKQYGFRFADDR